MKPRYAFIQVTGFGVCVTAGVAMVSYALDRPSFLHWPANGGAMALSTALCLFAIGVCLILIGKNNHV